MSHGYNSCSGWCWVGCWVVARSWHGTDWKLKILLLLLLLPVLLSQSRAVGGQQPVAIGHCTKCGLV
jgi:hypothetical protein